jgi:mannose PTS system EIIA component
MSDRNPKERLGLLLVSHGKLADELLDAAMKILGISETEAVSVCVDWTTESSAAKEQIRKALRKIMEDHGQVLILTDLFGGTPTNLSMTFYQAGSVEILTGANLPMVIKALISLSEEPSLTDLVALLKEKGQSAIVSVSEVMNPPEGSP